MIIFIPDLKLSSAPLEPLRRHCRGMFVVWSHHQVMHLEVAVVKFCQFQLGNEMISAYRTLKMAMAIYYFWTARLQYMLLGPSFRVQWFWSMPGEKVVLLDNFNNPFGLGSGMIRLVNDVLFFLIDIMISYNLYLNLQGVFSCRYASWKTWSFSWTLPFFVTSSHCRLWAFDLCWGDSWLFVQ